MLTAILLAAGTSRRMGDDNKLLLPWKDRTIVAATAANLLAAGIGEIIVVTGYEAPKITGALEDLPLRFIHNPAYSEGMTSSIRAGVCDANGDGFMICLADMVLISPAEYAQLAAAWEKAHALDSHCIGIPEYQGEKGNPVILPATLRKQILSHPEKEGCRQLVRHYQAHHLLIPMPHDHILRDIDRPEDYTLLSKLILP
ncbi:nucleotidyltransferase family protein [Puia sp. P3]|uniref:nucleotidyltransferase family protein n=1 Tax=Puia sp. P3 TaxID=3423952 RepID=UPI003D670140